MERTDKEKRVQISPRGIYSTNPGDTALAMLPPNVVPPPSIFSSISSNPPIDGPRATYRLWRGTHPNIAPEKAWSLGEDFGEEGNDDEVGQVEKSVKAAMAGVEHNKRSRKASHGLGIFKVRLMFWRV